ncbi:MAG: beta-lactamase family protein [Gammaproteobacteria bacterium]|nr:beta-lactamase family protein [Gammaproteobacteria bacterium]
MSKTSSPSSPHILRFTKQYIEEKKSAGMVTLVSQNGKAIHQSALGFQDIASQTPMTQDSIFRIYSMTKPITSVALMTLFEKGKFKLDDPAHHWIPALKTLKVYRNASKNDDLDSHITIRQLLTHTAGFSYGFDPDNNPVDKLYGEVWNALKQNKSLTELMEIVFSLPLFAQPGTRWHYSIATDVCGYLVELMSDMPFGDYLQQTIFDPLYMTDTAFEVTADKRHRFTTLYGPGDDGPLTQLEDNKDSPFIPPANMDKVNLQSGGGGLISTITDYWQFAQMVLNRGQLNGARILKPETIDTMTSNHVDEKFLPLPFNGIFPNPTDGYGFGLGYCITMQQNDIGSVGDFGWGGMADTYCWIDPVQQIVGILMQQFMPSLTHSGRLDFRRAVYASV